MEIYQSSKTAAEMEYALSAIPSIGANNHWFIGDQDTGVLAEGLTPYIGENEHWFVGSVDTGIVAKGLNPYVGTNGNWWVGEIDTGIYAGGVKVEGAEVGQTIVVKAVDENSKPTEWECADFPEGGSGGMEKVYSVVLTEPVPSIKITEIDGKPMSLKEWKLMVYIPNKFKDYATKVYIYPIGTERDSRGMTFEAATGDESASNVASARSDGDSFIQYEYTKYTGAPAADFRRYIPSGNVSTVVEICTYNNDKPLPIGTVVEVYGR